MNAPFVLVAAGASAGQQPPPVTIELPEALHAAAHRVAVAAGGPDSALACAATPLEVMGAFLAALFDEHAPAQEAALQHLDIAQHTAAQAHAIAQPTGLWANLPTATIRPRVLPALLRAFAAAGLGVAAVAGRPLPLTQSAIAQSAHSSTAAVFLQCGGQGVPYFDELATLAATFPGSLCHEFLGSASRALQREVESVLGDSARPARRGTTSMASTSPRGLHTSRGPRKKPTSRARPSRSRSSSSRRLPT
jgi:hypothetical protein